MLLSCKNSACIPTINDLSIIRLSYENKKFKGNIYLSILDSRVQWHPCILFSMLAPLSCHVWWEFQAASVCSRQHLFVPGKMKQLVSLLVTSVSPKISSHWFRLIPWLSLHPLFFVAKRMECADWLRSEVTCPPLDLEGGQLHPKHMHWE